MKSKDIKNIIEDFQTSSNRSLLIDGPWGCGKTFRIMEFIENNKKAKKSNRIKIDYISLFGKESIDEINTELHRTINPKLFKTKELVASSFNLISKVISPIPGIGSASGLVDEIGYAINNLENKDISGNRIIVFDDLERVDAKLSFISLLGYFNSLYFKQVRIICLISSTHINDANEGKNKEYHDFKEKIFDRVYVIDESDNEIITNYFSKHTITGLEIIVPEFNNNLRLANKTARFYDEIVAYLNKNNYDIKSKTSELQLVRSCNQTIKICLDHHNKPTIETEKDTSELFRKFAYDSDVEAVGENIANGIQKYLRAETNQSTDVNLQRYSERLVKSLIDIFLYRNYVAFDAIFKPRGNIATNIDFLDNEVFYLSDENKKLYYEEFLRRVENKKIIFDDLNIRRLGDIIKYTNFTFTEEQVDDIIDLLFLNEQEDNPKIFNAEQVVLDSLRTLRGDAASKALKLWENKMKNKKINIEVENAVNRLKKDYSNKNYSGLDTYIEQLSYKHASNPDNGITKFIVENNFMLPDLSGDITNDEWSYAHEMAKYAQKVNKGLEFKTLAIKICKENLENHSLIDRFHSLIFHKIDSEFNLKEELNLSQK